MKTLELIILTIVALVYVAACTTIFEDYADLGSQEFSSEQALREQNLVYFQCETYLTSNPEQNYCSETLPDDWRAFDFNGERLYSVPLVVQESNKNH